MQHNSIMTLIILASIILSGCGPTLNMAKDAAAVAYDRLKPESPEDWLKLIELGFKFASDERADNLDFLQDLGAKLGIAITTPTLQFLDALTLVLTTTQELAGQRSRAAASDVRVEKMLAEYRNYKLAQE